MPLISQGVSLKVPGVNNTGNETINQLIGNRNDGIEAATILGRTFDAWGETHSAQLIYPRLAAGVLITSHTDAWTLGNFIEVIPANTIRSPFHIHHLCVCATSANGIYILVLYSGTSQIAEISFARTDKKDDIEGIPIYAPHCVANARIQARLASSNAAQQDTTRMRLWYHLPGS